jgi:hypothetical protein
MRKIPNPAPPGVIGRAAGSLPVHANSAGALPEFPQGRSGDTTGATTTYR